MKSSIHDLVIVGAGSAGCVLAHRLSSEQATSVLLLEAGGPTTGVFKDMPIAFPRYVLRRDLNWNFQSEPEPYADNRVIEVPRGKALGGCSAIYGMVYARGHRLDYDDWARAGLSGWSYADVLPYFRLSERSWLGEGKYHGGDGPLEVCIPQDNLMYEELRTATLAAGFPVTDDFHGANSEGLQRNEMVVSRGRRGNVARTFLRPAMHRSNLAVESRALATRVLFEGTRAVGVEYLKDGQVHVARARQEVILSAGTDGSPQLLMLSGIGPADELSKHGIKPLVDLPGVGQNLIEHPFLPMAARAAGDVRVRDARGSRGRVGIALGVVRHRNLRDQRCRGEFVPAHRAGTRPSRLPAHLPCGADQCGQRVVPVYKQTDAHHGLCLVDDPARQPRVYDFALGKRHGAAAHHVQPVQGTLRC